MFLLTVYVSAKWKVGFIQARSQARYEANEELLPVAGAICKLPNKLFLVTFFHEGTLVSSERSLAGGRRHGTLTRGRVQHWCCWLLNISVSVCLSTLLSIIYYIWGGS